MFVAALLLACFISASHGRAEDDHAEESCKPLRALAAVLLRRSAAPSHSFLSSSGARGCGTLKPSGHGQHFPIMSSTPEQDMLPRARAKADFDPEWRQEVKRRLQRKRRLKTRSQQVRKSLKEVLLPTVLASLFGYFFFDEIINYLNSRLDEGSVKILLSDDTQYIQNFITVMGLLFSILAGNAYAALYEQQEEIYLALYEEVSEAKSLLEQTTLVCQNRPFYQEALLCIRRYIKNDLRRLSVTPADLLSSRPMEDPLESIMYMTSVGVPSIVYETVRSLRQARGNRLAAIQRKFPSLGIGLLYLLAFSLLLGFPMLGAAITNQEGTVALQAVLFACLCGSIELVLSIILELWRSTGGVFNVDEVLQQMVFGLEEELTVRAQQTLVLNPSAEIAAELMSTELATGKEEKSENFFKLPRKVRVFFGRLDRALMEFYGMH
mmetsp:Transcript_142648/g.273970  ORF Transcript_142648/g.273970 Transcript_142648/m.273970 type:complete len:438 (+) Transcript_142648:82-1395(+)